MTFQRGWAPLVAALLAAPGWAQEKPPRSVPTTAKPLRVDAKLTGLEKGLELKPIDGDAFSARVLTHKGTLHGGIRAQDDAVIPADTVAISLFFPPAGTTAQGYTWRFGNDGLRLRASSDAVTPAFSLLRIDAATAVKGGALLLHVAIPASAFPRFPAKDPLIAELCITYEDRDAPGAAPKRATNCTNGSMEGGAVRLSDDVRKSVGLKPPESVAGLEARENGWVGYAVLHYPAWVSSDVPLTAQVLRRMVTDQAVDPASAGINLPDALVLPDNRTVLSVLSGRDPYEVKGSCDADRELRLALYLVSGRTANRVLEWPASTCALGRAAAIELDEHGELTLGYTNGASVTFLWSEDHFERTEIGSR